MKNLSTFTINEAHISLEDLSLRAELTVADLRVREMIIVKLYLPMLLQGDGVYNITGTLADLLPVSGYGDIWVDMVGVKLTASSDLLVTADSRLEVRQVRLSLVSQEVRVSWWVCSTCSLPDYLLHIWQLLADILWLQVRSSYLSLSNWGRRSDIIAAQTDSRPPAGGCTGRGLQYCNEGLHCGHDNGQLYRDCSLTSLTSQSAIDHQYSLVNTDSQDFPA